MGDRAALRAAGNENFRAARYHDALSDYDRALAASGATDEGDEAALHANRSAALHALGDLKQALAAGLQATALVPEYAKGHLRVANGAQPTLGARALSQTHRRGGL